MIVHFKFQIVSIKSRKMEEKTKLICYIYSLYKLYKYNILFVR